jgi:hypothetical protein
MKNLIACTADALKSIGPLGGPISCWLHFEDGPGFNINSIILKLLELKCCHFAISGSGAQAIHDKIDDILIENTSELILTTWHVNSVSETVDEFLAVKCPSGDDPIRLVVVFADSDGRELTKLSQMIEALSLTRV